MRHVRHGEYLRHEARQARGNLWHETREASEHVKHRARREQ